MGTTIWYISFTSTIAIYIRLKRRYCAGDVVYINVLGRSVVILNSLQAARELLEKKSLIYSDRPRFVLMAELYVGRPVICDCSKYLYGSGWVGILLYHSSHTVLGSESTAVLFSMASTRMLSLHIARYRKKKPVISWMDC